MGLLPFFTVAWSPDGKFIVSGFLAYSQSCTHCIELVVEWGQFCERRTSWSFHYGWIRWGWWRCAICVGSPLWPFSLSSLRSPPCFSPCCLTRDAVLTVILTDTEV